MKVSEKRRVFMDTLKIEKEQTKMIAHRGVSDPATREQLQAMVENRIAMGVDQITSNILE